MKTGSCRVLSAARTAAGGRIYAATGSGSLFAIETGDPRDDVWPMWGGSAAHNGMPS